VDHGNQAWLLTGFTTTADPLVTSRFTITSVRVTGPLYGLQSRNGYDMPPDTKLTPAQLRRFFTRWSYPPVPMVWEGRFVSIQPVPVAAAQPSACPPPTASPTVSPPEPTAGPTPSGSPTPTATIISTASPSATPSAMPGQATGTISTPGTRGEAPPVLALAVIGVLAAAGSILALRSRRATR
jgi:hypothetical protein